MTVTLGELAVRFGCELRGEPSATVDSVSSLSGAGPRSVTFLANPKLIAQLQATRAGAVILDAKSLEVWLDPKSPPPALHAVLVPFGGMLSITPTKLEPPPKDRLF